MAATFPNAPTVQDTKARTTFEWLPGRQFLVQRWQAPSPAPDGIALIGFDPGRGTLLQHYFDSRGVARLYEMTFDDGVWTLLRTAPDFSALDFSQRFIGRFNEEKTVITGGWKTSEDGSSWLHDFKLSYTKLR